MTDQTIDASVLIGFESGQDDVRIRIHAVIADVLEQHDSSLVQVAADAKAGNVYAAALEAVLREMGGERG
jgi:bifunctional DNase/RNase